MNEIKCPKCGCSLKIDEDNYSNIIKQVRDHEFEEELSKRVEMVEKDKEKSIEIAIQKTRFQSQETSFVHEKRTAEMVINKNFLIIN